ncbi:hypothetical protein CVD28_14725 [Bacillus sp. M6-12]|nr:hypothetical protein CVD28_14725 [Bacillus sp. M6-12]
MTAFLYPEENPQSSGFLYLKVNKLMSEAGRFGHNVPKEGIGLPGSHTDFVFVTLTYSFGWAAASVIILLLLIVAFRMQSLNRNI